MKQTKKNIFLRFSISKRQKFVLATFLLTIGLIFTQLLKSDSRFWVVGSLGALAYILSAWVEKEDLTGIEWLTLLILPTMYTLAVGFSYFLLPARWITRLPVAFLYAFGMYALLLTENIYNVAAARTIQLLRAAHAVGFLLTLVTAFLLFQTTLAFHFPFWLNFFSIFIISLLLIFQALWSVNLEEGISKTTVLYSFYYSIILGEIALVFSFWPLNISLWALFLSACVYAFLGVGQQYLAGRLFKRTTVEFFLVPGFMLLILFFSAKWGG